MDAAPEPDTYDEKEVYAFFGLAAYSAQVLEKGLVNMVVAFKIAGLQINRDQFDDIFSHHDSRTLGELIQAARRQKIPIPEVTDQLLRKALNRRNYLNHDFFAEHAGHFMTEEGRRTMIKRLRDLILLFEEADRQIRPIYLPLLERMGASDKLVQEQASAMITRARYDQDA